MRREEHRREMKKRKEHKRKYHKRKEEKRERKRQHTKDTLADIERKQDSVPECLGVVDEHHEGAEAPGFFDGALHGTTHNSRPVMRNTVIVPWGGCQRNASVVGGTRRMSVVSTAP